MINKIVLACISILFAISLAHAGEPLELATKLIAYQMRVSVSSITPDMPLSKIGVGGDQLDAVELVMSIEEAVGKEITDAHFEKVMGKFDKSLSERITAKKVAQLISEL
jgi:acyl carrier protein